MFRLPGSEFDCSRFDYGVALESDCVVVTEHEKERHPKKIDATISQLAMLLTTIERGSRCFSEYSSEKMRFFLGGLEKQVRISIWRRHSWCGWFFIIIETIFWFGRLNALKKIEYRISLRPTSRQQPLSCILHHLFEQAAPKPSDIKPLFLPQIQIKPIMWRSFSCPGQRAAIPEQRDTSFYIYDPLFLRLLGIHSSRSSDLEARLRARLQNDVNFLYLASLLGQKLSNDAVRCIINVLGRDSRIVKRYEQIRSIEIEKEDPTGQHHKMTSVEMLYSAFFIEERIFKVDRVANAIFLEGGQARLPRALQYDSASNTVFLLAEPSTSKLFRHGQFKQISLAMKLPSADVESTPEVAVRALNRILEPIDLKQIEKDLEDYRKEIGFIRLLQDIQGCIKLYTEVSYPETIPAGVPVPRLSMVLQRGVKDLQDIAESGERLPLPRQKNIATQALGFFARMHEEKNVIHADIKGDNILLDEQGNIVIIDYGCAFNENIKRPKKTKPSAMYGQGSYGTMNFSCPDLFGHYNFRGNFRATDCFALGCVLYQLYFGISSPGSQALDDYADLVERNREVLESAAEARQLKEQLKDARKQARISLLQQIDERVEAPYQELAVKESLTPDEQYRLLIYGLMRKNPDDRFTMRQGLEFIEHE